MSGTIIRFPTRRCQVAYVVPERLGGWLVILRAYGWHYGSRREAVKEAIALARSHGLRVLAEEPR